MSPGAARPTPRLGIAECIIIIIIITIIINNNNVIIV